MMLAEVWTICQRFGDDSSTSLDQQLAECLLLGCYVHKTCHTPLQVATMRAMMAPHFYPA